MKNRELGFGYDIGYRQGKLWRRFPAQHVIKACQNIHPPALCLDLGCGEGKNAAYVASLGIDVIGVDGSYYAIKNAKEFCGVESNIEWRNCEASHFLKTDVRTFDLIVSTGMAHCLQDIAELVEVINLCRLKLKERGTFVFSCFNDRYQDFSGHESGFSPLVLPHAELLDIISQANFSVVESRDDNIDDLHPHIGVPHAHSLTRVICKISLGVSSNDR